MIWQRLRRISVEEGESVLAIVGRAYSTDPALLRRASWGPRDVTEVRQIAMYLIAVSLGCGATGAAEFFDCDRTTVLHAMRLVEEWREGQVCESIIERIEFEMECAGLVGEQA